MGRPKHKGRGNAGKGSSWAGNTFLSRQRRCEATQKFKQKLGKALLSALSRLHSAASGGASAFGAGHTARSIEAMSVEELVAMNVATHRKINYVLQSTDSGMSIVDSLHKYHFVVKLTEAGMTEAEIYDWWRKMKERDENSDPEAGSLGLHRLRRRLVQQMFEEAREDAIPCNPFTDMAPEVTPAVNTGTHIIDPNYPWHTRLLEAQDRQLMEKGGGRGEGGLSSHAGHTAPRPVASVPEVGSVASHRAMLEADCHKQQQQQQQQ